MNADAAGMNSLKLPLLSDFRTSGTQLWIGLTQLCHYCTLFLPPEARGAGIGPSHYAVIAITLACSLGRESVSRSY
jgi:hypothetical protein